MAPAEVAIAMLTEELESFGPGTPRQPAPGSADFFQVRALALGLSLLRRAHSLGVTQDPASFERFYRAALNRCKLDDGTPQG